LPWFAPGFGARLRRGYYPGTGAAHATGRISLLRLNRSANRLERDTVHADRDQGNDYLYGGSRLRFKSRCFILVRLHQGFRLSLVQLCVSPSFLLSFSVFHPFVRAPLYLVQDDLYDNSV
jgi:hypothetical protein